MRLQSAVIYLTLALYFNVCNGAVTIKILFYHIAELYNLEIVT